MKRPHAAFVVAEDDERIPIDFDGQIVSWRGYLAGMSRKEPTPPPDAVEFTAIEPSRDRNLLSGRATVAGWQSANGFRRSPS